MKKATATRRSFIRRTGTSLAAAGVAPGLIRAAGAGERIVIGVIGSGGRGTWLMKEAQKQGCHVAALCDVYEQRMDWAAVEVASKKPALYMDYEKLLERRDLDAVINATPDHWHHDVLIASVQAGKDVYTEKPFSHTIEEGANMVKAVRATKAIVQVGNHRRSGAHWRTARDVIASGVLGKITWARAFDTRSWVGADPFAARPIDENRLNWKKFLGTAPDQPLVPYRYWAWRWYWDFAGGLMTDIGAHQLDVLEWLTDSAGPRSVVTNGGIYFFKQWETPDVVHAVLDYGGFVGVFSVGFLNKYEGVGARFYGTEGTLVVTDKEFFFTKESGPDAGTKIESWPRTYEGPAHVANWLDCIKSRKEPNSPVELGSRVINAAHAGNVAYREGRRVTWDAERQQIVS
jgi:predicted dehydrogenase